ncbi:MAG: ATP-binding cassette domain-containing protein [Coriobacteriia bacterium]|nr:ATP-binding cassette domain-containing protein [Coriobacteriia bacterium]
MMFQVEHITVELVGDEGTFLAVDDVSLTLESSQIVDIVGPSGAGKSTFLHALALLVPYRSGDLILDGRRVSSFAPTEWRSLVALVQQKPTLIEGSVQTNLLLPWTLKVRREHKQPSFEEMRELLDRADLCDISLERSVFKLSVGQQARIAFIRTLLTSPKVLLLDEVDAALDVDSTRAIGGLVTAFSRQGGAVLRVRHKIDDGRASYRCTFEDGCAGVLESVSSPGNVAYADDISCSETVPHE